MDYEEEHKIVPRAVGCMRSRGLNRIYDAELVVNGVHYVVETSMKSHAAAVDRANEHVAALRLEMIDVASKYVTRLGLKKAKP